MNDEVVSLYRKGNKWSKQKRRIVIITVVLVFFSVVTLITSRSASGLEIIFRDTIANLEYYVIKAPVQYVTGLFDEYNDLKDVYEENAKLKEQLDNLARESAMNEVLTNELNDLKEMMEMNYLPTEYQVKYTNVISRDAENWSNQVTINLGRISGIQEGMAVVNAQGMIGTVTNVSEISSTE